MIDLADLRRKAGVTQVQLARSVGTEQPQISRLEAQRDMLLSSLGAYLTALGAHAKIVVEIGGHTVTYKLTGRKGESATDDLEEIVNVTVGPRRYEGLGPHSHVNVGCRQESGPGR
jgi:predicted transcriptional regulator